MLRRPAPPSRAVTLRQGAEGGELLESPALPGAVGGQASVLPAPPQRVERRHLEPEHGIAVNPALGGESAALSGEPLHVEPRLRRPGHLLHSEIERVPIAAAGRKVWARLLPHERERRVKGVQDDRAGPQLARRPGGEPSKVGEVADAPAFPRPQRVELGRPAPHPEPVRKMAPRWRDDESRRSPIVERPQLVVSEREIRRQISGHSQHRPVLQHELRGPVEHRGRLTTPVNQRSGGRRCGLMGRAHGRTETRTRLRPGRPPGPAGVDVAVLDPPGVRAQGVVAPSAAGSVKLTVVPWPSALSIRSSPPWAWTRCFTIASPSPVPPTSRERVLSTR